jgi:hypothetical protein
MEDPPPPTIETPLEVLNAPTNTLQHPVPKPVFNIPPTVLTPGTKRHRATSSLPNSEFTFEHTCYQIFQLTQQHQGKLNGPQQEIFNNIQYIIKNHSLPPSATTTPLQKMEHRLNSQEQVLNKILHQLETQNKITCPAPVTTASSSLSPPVNTAQDLSASTWAQVVTSSTTPTTNLPTAKPKNAPKPPSKPAVNNKLVVKTSLKSTNFNPTASRQQINKILADNSLPQSVVLVKLSANGNLILETRPGHTAEDLHKHYDLWAPAIAATQSQVFEKWHKVVVHGVPTDFYSDAGSEQQQLEAIQQDIEEFNPQVKLITLPRWLTRAESRQNKQHSSIVVAVKTQQEAKSLNKKKLIVAGLEVKTTAYEDRKKSTPPTTNTDSTSMEQ